MSTRTGPWGFTRITPTTDETLAYRESHKGHNPGVYRVRCDACGKRIWGSGLGIGSHRKACKGAITIPYNQETRP